MAKGIVLSLLISLFILQQSYAQPDRWQQRIKYAINVKMDVVNNQFAGTEQIDYWNNSPDTLNRVFFHLYWNAFKPNSSMDVRSREAGKVVLWTDKNDKPILDWDGRVTDRISKLTDNEIGYQNVSSIRIEGIEQQLILHETILEVRLSKPILPKSKVALDLTFRAQVPVQIRRSGRDNAEGIRFSMSQWYPKMVEYDYQGWNANPYVAREFYGVWGDYDVKINIDKNYMIAATGVLQNANTIGFGYENAGVNVPSPKDATITWNFKGENIHDFVWAADPTFKHLSKKVNGITLNVFYKPSTKAADDAWANVLWAAEKVLPYMEDKFGKYPYPQYSFIQGGDGGMEYAMATLIKSSSLGTVFHEWMHNWYQHILGTNESLFAWMDEGFTTFSEGEVSSYFKNNWAAQSPFTTDAAKAGLVNFKAKESTKLPLHQADSYEGYFMLVNSNLEEPLSTHADHFSTNFAYSQAAYSKGAVFISQLGYIVGDSLRDKILLEYYNQWKFKHPNINDFIRVAEKVSGITLQWYKEYWVNSTKKIDYAIGNIDIINGKTTIALSRNGKMPMPLDVLITFKDGSQELHYIPLNLMYGNKPSENNIPRFIHEEWRWTHPNYDLEINRSVKDIKSIEIDPTRRLADTNSSNNKLVIPN